MRCPKCGYISFDLMERCLKCNKIIKEAAGSVHGSVYRSAAPSFLQFRSMQEEKKMDIREEAVDTLEDDQDFIDDDLEVLVKNEASDVELSSTFDEPEEDEKEDEIEMDDREIVMDLSSLNLPAEEEEVEDEEVSPESEPEGVGLSMELPPELNDLSDLAPPAKEQVQDTVVAQVSSVAEEPEQLSLEDLDFDLSLDGLEGERTTDSKKETILALDDIDFSEALNSLTDKKPETKSTSADMDGDLDFDLDLGGLSLHKEA